MTPVSHEQSLAAEDEGGGVLEETNDNMNNKMMRASSPGEGDPEETEDEEVKVNCAGGFAGIQDSDLSSDEDSDEEGSDLDPEEDAAELKEFVASQQSAGMNIQRPRAVLASSPNRSPRADEDDDEDDVDSTMDESSDDELSSGDEARGLGMTLEVTKLDDQSDDESLSDASSRYSGAASSAGGVAGSDSESEDDDDDKEEQDEALEGYEEEPLEQDEADEANEPEDEEMSDDESTASVPFDTFNNCDGPSDVIELESALQDSRHENADDASSVASEDSEMLQDPTLQSALLCEIVELEPPKANPNALAHVKRVLSSSALLGRSTSWSAPNPAMLSPKRVCRGSRGSDESSGSDEDGMPPELSLGQVAYKVNPRVSVSDEDDEEQDRQLGEELREGEAERERESTPIPLLTPPSSPLRVEGDEGDVTVCEWPSNLAVDSAMTATMGLRPPSPQNLQSWEQQEEERLMKSDASPKPPTGADEGAFSSSLTPMMRGISVEPDAPFLRL